MNRTTKTLSLGAGALLLSLALLALYFAFRPSTPTTSPAAEEYALANVESPVLHWAAPAKNTDGSALSDLAGYIVYWGTAPGEYPNSVRINDPSVTHFPLPKLSPDTYYFVTTAINRQDIESDHSAIARVRVEPGGNFDIVVLDRQGSSEGLRQAANDTRSE